jgi:DNA-binding transcriptional LysR family regulator
VAVVVSSFLAVPHVLSGTDAVAIVPAPFARRLEAAGRVRCWPLPPGLPAPVLRMRLLWAPRTDGSAAWRWLRELIATAGQGHR